MSLNNTESMKKLVLIIALLTFSLGFSNETKTDKKEVKEVEKKETVRVYKNKNYRVIKALKFYNPVTNKKRLA